MPALARAQKVLRRLNRRGLDVTALAPGGSRSEPDDPLAIGAGLLDAVRAAEAAGVDAEGALRLATAAVERAAADG